MNITPLRWYAIGRFRESGWFDARRLVVGRLLAREEKRDGEKIIPVKLLYAGPRRAKPGKRRARKGRKPCSSVDAAF